MNRRLAEDLQLTLIIIVAVLACIFISPFAVFRFLQKNYLLAAVDGAIVLTSAGAAILAWKTGKTRIPGLIISLLCSGGVIIVSYARGIEGILWVYPLIMFIFYLTPSGIAFLMILAVTAALAFREISLPQSIFLTRIHLASFLTTTATAASFSYAFARRNKRHRIQLMRWATNDSLTGLDNRRSLEKELQIALSTEQHHGVDFGLIIMDLDNFKQINDQYGHSEGDRVLRELARLISSSIRLSDQAFRYGGDEFVILLSNTTLRGLEEVCRNMLRNIRSNIQCGGSPVTVSIGGALLGTSNDTESWFMRADRCLYTAKENGRDQVCTDDKEENQPSGQSR